jgi:hypothetical protein
MCKVVNQLRGSAASLQQNVQNPATVSTGVRILQSLADQLRTVVQPIEYSVKKTKVIPVTGHGGL